MGPLPGSAAPWDTGAERHRRRRSSGVTRDWARAGSRGSDRHMTMLVAAIAATVSAIVESTITPYLRIGNAQPHLLFVLAVVWTVAVGLDSGLVWAFIGGLALDTLTQRPLGTTAFALLVAVGVTAAFMRVLSRLRPIASIVITALLS